MIIGMFCPGYSAQEGAGNTVLIPLAYPQKSNAPKQQHKAVKAEIVSGKMAVSVSGMLASQSNSPALYVEYFLDDQAVYSSKESKALLFELDTAGFADGEHTLTANLWDENGPSAIGMKKISIRNQIQNEK